ERLGLVFVFFMCASLGAALDVFEPRRRLVIAICAAVVLIAAVFLAMPMAHPFLAQVARTGIAVLQKRNYLRLPAAIYESRLEHYLSGFQAVALRRIAVPAACVLPAALALARGKRILIAAEIAVELTG